MTCLNHPHELKAAYQIPAGLRPRKISSVDMHELLLDVLQEPEAETTAALLELWSTFAHRVISMADVEEMARVGHVPADVLQAIADTYASFVVKEVRSQTDATARAMAAGWLDGVDGVDVRRVQAIANGEAELRPAIMQALDQRADRLAVELTEGQQNALNLLVEFYTQTNPSPAGTLAKRINDFVGLTERETRAVLNYRTGLADEGLAGRTLDARVAQYADLMQHRRALRIARTELAFAANEGQKAALDEARAQGLVVGQVVRRWTTADNEAVCSQCGDELDGMTAPEGESFTAEVDDPPAHPACGCSTDYLEMPLGME